MTKIQRSIIGNYTGPYWSNGKIQSSVLWGQKKPLSALDALARRHDAAYAKFPDSKHRQAADSLFEEGCRKILEHHPDLVLPEVMLAKLAVGPGNRLLRGTKPKLRGTAKPNNSEDGRFLMTVYDFYGTDPYVSNDTYNYYGEDETCPATNLVYKGEEEPATIRPSGTSVVNVTTDGAGNITSRETKTVTSAKPNPPDTSGARDGDEYNPPNAYLTAVQGSKGRLRGTNGMAKVSRQLEELAQTQSDTVPTHSQQLIASQARRFNKHIKTKENANQSLLQSSTQAYPPKGDVQGNRTRLRKAYTKKRHKLLEALQNIKRKTTSKVYIG